MHSSDDVQYAMETTQVLHEPDRRIDTFGDTSFEFTLLSELMDHAGQIRIRSGRVEAARPKLVKPDGYNDFEFEGFDDSTREKFSRLLDKLRQQGADLAFLNYGFQFRRTDVSEEIVHDRMEIVRDRVLTAARERGNPAEVVIEGVDDAWEVSVLKFTLELMQQSLPINRFDFQRRGLL